MGLDEAAKKVKSLPATVTAAMQIKTLHHHKKHRHGDNSALLQQEEEAKKKSIEAALDKAKLTLSNMMEETKEEMDKAILTCTEFDSQTVSTLDINKGYRAQLAAQVAEAKGFIAQAKMMISEATTELDSLKTISEEHAQQCFITITAKQEGLRILESDLSVSMKVENMTSCDDVTPGSTTTTMRRRATRTTTPRRSRTSTRPRRRRRRRRRRSRRSPTSGTTSTARSPSGCASPTR